jgi:hypothetical protein
MSPGTRVTPGCSSERPSGLLQAAAGIVGAQTAVEAARERINHTAAFAIFLVILLPRYFRYFQAQQYALSLDYVFRRYWRTDEWIRASSFFEGAQQSARYRLASRQFSCQSADPHDTN